MKRSHPVVTSDDLDPLPPGAAPGILVLSFSVRGVAEPFTRVSPGRNGAVYECAKYRHWKSLVTDAALAEIARTGWKTTAAAVRVDVETVLVNRPTKRPRKGGALAHPIAGKSVMDLDNATKGVLDAMQRATVYRNDLQVVKLVAEKRWQRPDEDFAGAIVRVEIVG